MQGIGASAEWAVLSKRAFAKGKGKHKGKPCLPSQLHNTGHYVLASPRMRHTHHLAHLSSRMCHTRHLAHLSPRTAVLCMTHTWLNSVPVNNHPTVMKAAQLAPLT